MAKTEQGDAAVTPAANPTPAKTGEVKVTLQYDHTYKGTIYLRGERTVDAETAEALKASEERVTAARRNAEAMRRAATGAPPPHAPLPQLPVENDDTVETG